MKKISTEKAPAAIGPYSQGVVVNNTLFSSGQIALDPATGEIVGFPDDDCTYSKNVLEDVKNSFVESNFDFVLLKANDPISHIKFITRENRILVKNDIIKILPSK